jgi:hypothetical protein
MTTKGGRPLMATHATVTVNVAHLEEVQEALWRKNLRIAKLENLLGGARAYVRDEELRHTIDKELAAG